MLGWTKLGLTIKSSDKAVPRPPTFIFPLGGWAEELFCVPPAGAEELTCPPDGGGGVWFEVGAGWVWFGAGEGGASDAVGGGGADGGWLETGGGGGGGGGGGSAIGLLGLIGLMGDVGLVGFVTDFTQLFDVVVQGNQIEGW